MKLRSITAFVVLILLVVGSGLGYYYYRISKISSSVSETGNSSLAPANPIKTDYKLPSGSQTYRFSHGPLVKGPKIQYLTIDPLDPKSGATQKFSLTISSSTLLTEARITVYTDNKTKVIGLKFISGDLKNGLYQGSWQIDDTYSNRYAFRFLLTDSTGTYDNTMTPAN